MTAAIISSRNMVSAHYANIYNVQPIMRAYIYFFRLLCWPKRGVVYAHHVYIEKH